MKTLWWIAGGLLALLWVDRLRDAASGMPSVADITRPEWNRKPRPAPPVSIIVPARNEEGIVEEALTSMLRLDYPEFEVIAVDDRSTDRTGAILDELAARHGGPPPLSVMHVADLPRGWLGKPHAMWTAAQRVRGEWLLFTDADVLFRPDCLRRAIAYAEHTGIDHLILFPTQELRSAGEKIMLGAFQMLFIFGHRPWKVADPKTKDFMGLGAFNLVRRNAYEAVGGFRALRMEIIDDMKLGKLIKQHGFTQHTVRGPELLTLHWGEGALGLVRNLTKNFFAVMEFRWPKALGAISLLLLFNLGPLLGLWRAPGWTKLPFGLALAALAALHVGMAQRSRVPARYFLLYPVGTLLLAYTMLRSMAHTLRHRGVVWRGTRYELEELRKGLV